MRVAVTGVAGDVGGFVVRELAAAGHKVVGLDLREPEDLPLVPCVRGSVTEPDDLRKAFAGCDGVVHLAAIRDPGIVPDETLFQINVGGTFNALEAAAGCGVRRQEITQSSRIVSTPSL